MITPCPLQTNCLSDMAGSLMHISLQIIANCRDRGKTDDLSWYQIHQQYHLSEVFTFTFRVWIKHLSYVYKIWLLCPQLLAVWRWLEGVAIQRNYVTRGELSGVKRLRQSSISSLCFLYTKMCVFSSCCSMCQSAASGRDN